VGDQWTIDRPLFVKRVSPPTLIRVTIIPAVPRHRTPADEEGLWVIVRGKWRLKGRREGGVVGGEWERVDFERVDVILGLICILLEVEKGEERN